MIKLNIIPDKIKKEIKVNFIYNIIKKSLYILIIVFSVAGIILLASEYILLSSLAKEINGSTLDFKSSVDTSQNKVSEINNEIILLENIQADHVRWSVLFNYISTNSPDGISFRQINIDKKVPSISFNGLAVSRDQLLSFKIFLEDSSIFENIDFPIQNLLQKENINFEINAKLNIYEIK
ncbi:MAG: hypothetical protein PF572_03710 [Patescibacteria group bacterium]|jgi:Tfp pilus assembly protein PilN|nr:hypothetical protein [Patescibacteria group bacterium]